MIICSCFCRAIHSASRLPWQCKNNVPSWLLRSWKNALLRSLWIQVPEFFLLHMWVIRNHSYFSWLLNASLASLLGHFRNHHLLEAGKNFQIQHLTWTWMPPPFRASLDRAKISSGPTKTLLWIQGRRDDGDFLPAKKGFCNFPPVSGKSSSPLTTFGAGVGWGDEVALLLAFDGFLCKNYLPQTRDKTRNWNRQLERKGLGIFLSQCILWLPYGGVMGRSWCHGKFYF